MKMFIVQITQNEWGNPYNKFMAPTLEECLKEIKSSPTHYTDWYAPTGCCTIIEVDEYFNNLATYDVRNCKLAIKR